MRREAIWAGAILLFPFDAFFAQNAPAPTARIVGIVVDSIDQTGLRGAEILVSGHTSPVITDSLGRFDVEGLSPGTYQVGAFHPLLETLGLTLATKPFSIGRDSTGVAVLAIPSMKTLASRYCGDSLTQSLPAVIAGRVRDPDTDDAIRGATVSIAWADINVSERTQLVRTPHELHVDTDASGFFKFCGLPRDIEATVQASRADVKTGEVTVSTGSAPLAFEDLRLASSPSARRSGVVRGIVRSLDDKALAGARVEAQVSGAYTVTRPDGTFTLDSVPTGTQLIVVRQLGFQPISLTVNVTSREPTDMKVAMGPTANIMNPVLVTARRNSALEKDGFFRRQRSGFGTYFTRDDIDKRQPMFLTDVLTNVSGVRVVRTTRGAIVRSSQNTSIVGGGSCTRLWVDGAQWGTVMPGDIDTAVSPDEVAGMEVYRPGDVPPQFAGFGQCLTIVIWTDVQPQVRQH
ncbi:MAG TPA: carboxypeptidase regulatory-like domain-containing protein [Gemmatimonadaceae bacterium]